MGQATPKPGDEDQVEGQGPGVAAFAKIDAMRQAAAQDEREEREEGQPERERQVSPAELPFKVEGKVPQGFLDAMKSGGRSVPGAEPKRGFGQMGQGQQGKKPAKKKDQQSAILSASSGQLKELLEGLKGSTTLYEEIELPSKGRFYDGTNGPTNGVVAIRPMTGEEEQILATPRFVRKGQAINMIFSKCMKDDLRPENLLTVDRTYLLIYLRGISYSPQYDVEVKCPECEKKFATTIDLNTLYVEPCPEDFGPDLTDVLPTSKYKFTYRLSTGKDEQEIQDYRDRRIKHFGDAAADDTLTHRTAQLLVDIEGLTDKRELQMLIKSLPINDVAYIRNCVNEPPFGVDTDVEIICPSCLHEFQVDLPLEANFFFPRKKKESRQA
jgi:hypothetical protein